jgi:hypothetical protein
VDERHNLDEGSPAPRTSLDITEAKGRRHPKGDPPPGATTRIRLSPAARWARFGSALVVGLLIVNFWPMRWELHLTASAAAAAWLACVLWWADRQGHRPPPNGRHRGGSCDDRRGATGRRL